MTTVDLSVLLLGFTIALCTYSLFTKGGALRQDPFIGREKLYAALCAAMFALSLAVRLYEFGAVPSGLNQDGAMAAVDAAALARYGTDRLGMRLPVYFTAWDYGQMNVLMSYMTVPFIKVFGLTITVARLPMLLTSLAGIVVIFLFAKKAFGPAPALIVLAFAAINPWHIMQSRWALECNLFPHMLLFGLYCIYLGLDKRVWLYVSMAFFGLAMYTYGIAFYTTPLLMIVLCAYFVAKKRVKLWEAGVCALVYLFFAWPIFAVVIVNAFKLPTIDTGIITIPLFPNSIRTRDLIIFTDDFFGQLQSNFRSLVNMVVLDTGDFSWSYIKGYGHMYLFTLPFVVMGIWHLFRRFKPKPDAVELSEPAPDTAARFIFGAWLAVAVFSGLMVNNVNTNRINIIWYPYIVLAALGIWRVVSRAPQVKPVVVAVAALYLASFGGFSTAYFGEHSRVLAKDFCSGLNEAIRYADTQDTDVLYITAYSRSEEAYTCSEIYTMFATDMDAHYFQGKADAVNRATGKALLPYKQRYQYVDFDNFPFDKKAGAVYVFNNDEEGIMFRNGDFDVTDFGLFGVAVQRVDSAPEEEEPEQEALPDGENTGEEGSGEDSPDTVG